MNERIKELAQQAGYTLVESNECPEIYTFNTEKFAELIVRECIKCCDDLERTNQHYISKFGIDPDIRPKQCIEVIKQHFGVGE